MALASAATRTAPSPGAWRLALVGPSAAALAALRRDLILDLVMRRHVILGVTPPALPADLRAVRDLGALHRPVDIEAPGLRLLSDWKAITGLIAVFKDWQPHVVMGFGLRPMIFAAIAARRARVRRVVSLVNGLPREGIDGVGARRFATAMRASDAVVFHNRDHRRRLETEGILPKGLPVVVVPGAGVNLKHHRAEPLPPTEPGLVFLMIARLERSRGVMEYALAARALKARAPACRFLLVGPRGRGGDAVTPEAFRALGTPVEYLGPTEDVRTPLGRCHVFVYPSYAEGMPRTVLEALAAGRPVITTDAPGCRETVDDKVNGCLVPAGDAEALASAMESFVRRPDLLPATARAARLKAERRFDARDVNRALRDVLDLD